MSLKLRDGRYFKRKGSAAKRKKPVTRLGTGAVIPAITSSRTDA